MKIFLIHRQDILKSIKQVKTKESHSRLLLKKKVASILKLIKMHEIVKFVLYRNYINLKNSRILQKRMENSAKQISRRYIRAIKKRSKHYDGRRTQEIK
jgi:hypothetical protein